MKISLISGKSFSASPELSLLENLDREGIYLTSSCGGKGTCGKCKIIIKSGTAHTDSKMKLSNEELGKGYMLACQSSANEDLLIDIPKESMLTDEGKIATGKSKDLLALLNTIGAKIDPLTERLLLKLPQPSLTDNISDLERLKRELLSRGLGCLRVPFRFLKDLAGALREEDWEVTLSTIKSDECHEITKIIPGHKETPRYGIAFDIGTTTLALYIIDLTDGNLLDIASTYNSQIRLYRIR